MESLHLIVGLGNPGTQYAGTRHNAGFLLAERLANRWRTRWRMASRFNAQLARTRRGRCPIVLCQPQSYMNFSGMTVRKLTDYYRVPAGQLLVLVDDADLPLGQLRLRPGGSSGGHHGLESIETCLSSRDYPRLRLGIGRQADGPRQITDYVLSRFGAGERPLLDQVLDRAAQQVECWLDAGIQTAMNHYNGIVHTP